jgi:hypothetical protein
MAGSRKRKTLIQKLAKHESRKIPSIPNHYFQRPEVPPPTNFDNKEENKKHYQYKIFLGETIRNRLPHLSSHINYDYDKLPPMWHERYAKYLTYLPDIFIKWRDDGNEIIYLTDIEINGLIHYKNKTQILKMIERRNLVYPYLCSYKEQGFDDYRTIASYMIIDVDEFEYQTINDIFHNVKETFYNGGLNPPNMDSYLQNYLKVAM